MNKIKPWEKFLARSGVVFGVLNMVDLYLTLEHYEAEINPLVLANFPLFYMLKFVLSWLILSICWHKLH